MPTEPDYLAQTGEHKTPQEQREWIKQRGNEAKQQGCVHARYSWSDAHGLLLFEGWKAPPDDEGEPRFQLTCATEGSSNADR